ncbi:MAG: malate synthase A [Halobacteriovoraceae bacterium]|nr:malate synthase A [Halobacteriovoraceae bacterium]
MQGVQELGHGVKVSAGFKEQYPEIFDSSLIEYLSKLHRHFEIRRQQLLACRGIRARHYHQGKLPEYGLRDSVVVCGDWRVAPLPADYQQRRVEITGPVNDPKMVVKMLSRGSDGFRADTAMLDFEDSMKPTFKNVLNGVRNVRQAARGELSFSSGEKEYHLDSQDMAGLMVRVRGLHLREANLTVDDQPVSAGLFDFAMCFFHSVGPLLRAGKTPKYYVPKCEHYLEARWWNDLFTQAQELLGIERGTLRATFLIETLPAAFQIEEILYEIREHAAGLNVGRWDKIFSDIKTLKMQEKRISCDRSEIGMDSFWMDNYAKRLVKICHERGAMAIGGMSAFTPGSDSSIRKRQTAKVLADKQNECSIGHDGCWVSHPYFIGTALSAFPKKNQLEEKLESFNRFPNLIMDCQSAPTLEGLRKNIRVGIGYLEGWSRDLGCVAWDDQMEDLATLEISRAQTWQWLHHGVILKGGEPVNPSLIAAVFEEELYRILFEIDERFANLEAANINQIKLSYVRAKVVAKELFLKEELSDFLCESSDIEEAESVLPQILPKTENQPIEVSL